MNSNLNLLEERVSEGVRTLEDEGFLNFVWISKQRKKETTKEKIIRLSKSNPDLVMEYIQNSIQLVNEFKEKLIPGEDKKANNIRINYLKESPNSYIKGGLKILERNPEKIKKYNDLGFKLNNMPYKSVKEALRGFFREVPSLLLTNPEIFDEFIEDNLKIFNISQTTSSEYLFSGLELIKQDLNEYRNRTRNIIKITEQISKIYPYGISLGCSIADKDQFDKFLTEGIKFAQTFAEQEKFLIDNYHIFPPEIKSSVSAFFLFSSVVLKYIPNKFEIFSECSHTLLKEVGDGCAFNYMAQISEKINLTVDTRMNLIRYSNGELDGWISCNGEKITQEKVLKELEKQETKGFTNYLEELLGDEIFSTEFLNLIIKIGKNIKKEDSYGFWINYFIRLIPHKFTKKIELVKTDISKLIELVQTCPFMAGNYYSLDLVLNKSEEVKEIFAKGLEISKKCPALGKFYFNHIYEISRFEKDFFELKEDEDDIFEEFNETEKVHYESKPSEKYKRRSLVFEKIINAGLSIPSKYFQNVFVDILNKKFEEPLIVEGIEKMVLEELEKNEEFVEIKTIGGLFEKNTKHLNYDVRSEFRLNIKFEEAYYELYKKLDALATVLISKQNSSERQNKIEYLSHYFSQGFIKQIENNNRPTIKISSLMKTVEKIKKYSRVNEEQKIEREIIVRGHIGNWGDVNLVEDWEKGPEIFKEIYNQLIEHYKKINIPKKYLEELNSLQETNTIIKSDIAAIESNKYKIDDFINNVGDCLSKGGEYQQEGLNLIQNPYSGYISVNLYKDREFRGTVGRAVVAQAIIGGKGVLYIDGISGSQYLEWVDCWKKQLYEIIIKIAKINSDKIDGVFFNLNPHTKQDYAHSFNEFVAKKMNLKEGIDYTYERKSIARQGFPSRSKKLLFEYKNQTWSGIEILRDPELQGRLLLEGIQKEQKNGNESNPIYDKGYVLGKYIPIEQL